MESFTSKLEARIKLDRYFFFSMLSYVSLAAMFFNMTTFNSPILGFLATLVYFWINSVFFGASFLAREDVFLRLMFGILLLILIIGFIGWIVIVLYVLNAVTLISELAIATTIASMLNRAVRRKGDQDLA